jgi:hypothetical protein
MILLLLSLVSTDVLVYSPGFDTVARYQQQIARVFYGQDPMVVCDTCLPAAVDSADVYFIGSPDSRFYRRHWRNLLPVQFDGNAVSIWGATFTIPEYIFHCQFKTPDGRGIELTLAPTPGAALGETDLNDHDFVLSRLCDGPISEQDQIAWGNLEWANGRLKASDVTWNQAPARSLDTISDEFIHLLYQPSLLDAGEARSFFRLAELEYEAIRLPYGLMVPRPVSIYLTAGAVPDGGSYASAARMTTIWLRYAGRAALMDSTGMPVYVLAREMARIAFEPASSEYPFSPYASDWADYASMVGIIPYVQAALGISAWFVPGKLADLGIPRFRKLYQGCEGTYAWLLYQIDQEYSQRSIGEAIQVVLAGQDTRVADIREFMTTLGSKVGDAKFVRRIAAAFPTPLDHTLFGVRGWRDLGARPTLDEMFADNTFTIKTVEPGSIAKSLGFRPGDRILTIDDLNPVRDKAQCLRRLLKKEKGQPVTFLVQRSRLQQKIVMAVE